MVQGGVNYFLRFVGGGIRDAVAAMVWYRVGVLVTVRGAGSTYTSVTVFVFSNI
jgi:hypothetical protein